MYTGEIKGSFFQLGGIPTDLKQELFQGLDTMSKTEGRIYKEIDASGKCNFFRAEGFWKSIYHFLCSQRMSVDDLASLNNRVTKHINSSDDVQLNALISATFNEVLRSVNKNSTWFFPRDEVWSFLYNNPHTTLINNAADKVVKKQPITAGEVILLKQVGQMPPCVKRKNIGKSVMEATTRIINHFKKLDENLISLFKQIPQLNFPSPSSLSDWLKNLDDEEKNGLNVWLEENITSLPAYFNLQMGLDELLQKVKDEQTKEVLRQKYGFQVDDFSPICYTSWKDIQPASLFIVQDGELCEITKSTTQEKPPYQIHDLTPDQDNDFIYFDTVFKKDWESGFTRISYTLDTWFAFIKICRANKIEVNPQDHLMGALKRLFAEKKTVSTDDWEKFISICEKNKITINREEDWKVFVSICMENLINDIVKSGKKIYDKPIMDPYLDVLNDSMIQDLPLPDTGDLTVSDPDFNLWGQDFQRAAIYLWNGLKASGIITTAPSDELVDSAKKQGLELQQ